MRRIVLAGALAACNLPSVVEAQAREEPVRFVAAGDTLAGTLALPRGSGPFPAVVLLSGMLQDTRDASSGAFRTFKVLSDTLAAFGVAVLRYDDRGLGESQGRNTWEYTLEEHAQEAVAAIQWLRSRPEIDPARVGLFGHSYGGPMAARAARQMADPAFVILASPHVARDRDIILGMVGRQTKAAGQGPAATADEVAFVDRVMRTPPTDAEAWKRHAEESTRRARARYTELPDSLRQRRSFEAFFGGSLYPLLLRLGPTALTAYFWDLDLVPDYASIRAPVLTLFGENDGQVVAAENEPVLRQALATSGNQALTVRVIPGANHYLRGGRTPAGQFAEGVVETMARWLRDQRIVP